VVLAGIYAILELGLNILKLMLVPEVIIANVNDIWILELVDKSTDGNAFKICVIPMLDALIDV
jgi:hypothetical protein